MIRKPRLRLFVLNEWTKEDMHRSWVDQLQRKRSWMDRL